MLTRKQHELLMFINQRLAATGVAPRLREVDVYLGWFGPASKAVHLGSRVTPLIARTPALIIPNAAWWR